MAFLGGIGAVSNVPERSKTNKDVTEVCSDDLDYTYIETNPVPSNDTIAFVKNLQNWPKGFSGEALRGVTWSGDFDLYYGRWFDEKKVTGGFLLHNKNYAKTWTRTGDIEIIPGRKYSANLDTSHFQAMKNRESIGMELLSMYAVMGWERVAGDYGCSARVSVPNYTCEVDEENLPEISYRADDPIRFMIVGMPKNLVQVDKIGRWHADVPLVLRKGFVLELAKRTGLNIETSLAKVGDKQTEVYHLFGRVKREKYLRIIIELNEENFEEEYCLLGFDVKEIDENHWSEISYDKVSTLLPSRGWCRPDGTQSNWDLSSQIIYRDEEDQISKEFKAEIVLKQNIGTTVTVEGTVSKKFLDNILKVLCSETMQNTSTIPNAKYTYVLSKCPNIMKEYLGDLRTEERIVLKEIINILYSRYRNNRERDNEESELFSTWTIFHNLGVKNFDNMKEQVIHVYEDMKESVFKKTVYLEMCKKMKRKLYAVSLGILLLPIFICLFLHNYIWCTEASCSNKDWLELVAFSFTIPASLLTLTEIALGDSGILRMISTGKARVRDLNSFTNITGLSKNSFWSLVLIGNIHKIVKPVSYKTGSIVKLLRPLYEEEDSNKNNPSKNEDFESEEMISKLFFAENVKPSPDRRSLSQSIRVGEVCMKELEHLIIFDLKKGVIATADRCRKIVRNENNKWKIEFEGRQTEIEYEYQSHESKFIN